MREDTQCVTSGFEVAVTFDERRGYVASAAELRSPVVALSLSGLRRRIETALLPDDVNLRLILDRTAERERNRRRPAPPTGAGPSSWPVKCGPRRFTYCNFGCEPHKYRASGGLPDQGWARWWHQRTRYAPENRTR
jgi:hypothetical protein